MEEEKGTEVKMLPKAKAKVKAKAKAVGKAKAKPMARAPARVRGRGALRRPAGIERFRSSDDPKAAWDAGRNVNAGDLKIDWVVQEKSIVVESGRYFHKECKLAGKILGFKVTETGVVLTLQPTGTTDEGLLRLQSGTPQLQLRVLLCPASCNHEEVSEDLVHAVVLRKLKEGDGEAPWTNNLEKVAPAEDEDQLEALREQMQRGIVGAPARGGGAGEAADTKEDRKAKDKKEKKRRDKERKRRRESPSEDSVSGKAALDGTQARKAAQKAPRLLFKGTGLDSSERVRSRVFKLARRYVKKKAKKSSSSSRSSSGSSQGAPYEEEGDTVFQQAVKVRQIADSYPGVLAAQALGQMRSNLLQTLGEDDQAAAGQAVAVQYYRQVLQRKATGAVARELLTLCAAADMLLKGKAAPCLDLLLQRVKSSESTLGGVHWSVSQKLELLPAEQATLTATAEMREAQRVAMEEAKTRWMSSLPDGRPQQGQKSGGKGKTPNKEDYRKGDGKKGGRGKGQKGDWQKKGEESTPKSS